MGDLLAITRVAVAVCIGELFYLPLTITPRRRRYTPSLKQCTM